MKDINYQNSSLFNYSFLNWLDEELATLVKWHQLNRAPIDSQDLVNLAEQISKTIKRTK